MLIGGFVDALTERHPNKSTTQQFHYTFNTHHFNIIKK